jgi:hypothetical protein
VKRRTYVLLARVSRETRAGSKEHAARLPLVVRPHRVRAGPPRPGCFSHPVAGRVGETTRVGVPRGAHIVAHSAKTDVSELHPRLGPAPRVSRETSAAALRGRDRSLSRRPGGTAQAASRPASRPVARRDAPPPRVRSASTMVRSGTMREEPAKTSPGSPR